MTDHSVFIFRPSENPLNARLIVEEDGDGNLSIFVENDEVGSGVSMTPEVIRNMCNLILNAPTGKDKLVFHYIEPDCIIKSTLSISNIAENMMAICTTDVYETCSIIMRKADMMEMCNTILNFFGEANENPT